MTTDNIINTYPITKGELLYIKDVLASLYTFAIENEDVSLPEEAMLVNTFQEASTIINKILEFKEEEELERS